MRRLKIDYNSFDFLINSKKKVKMSLVFKISLLFLRTVTKVTEEMCQFMLNVIRVLETSVASDESSIKSELTSPINKCEATSHATQTDDDIVNSSVKSHPKVRIFGANSDKIVVRCMDIIPESSRKTATNSRSHRSASSSDKKQASKSKSLDSDTTDIDLNGSYVSGKPSRKAFT
ncbi:hypothetical protein CEXT_516641 [Caerostris extrusa]|uniref:Uncharacterized protein n=1 Tax=Caerostris extrusa TaxID=172846 RepID=A0AAV4PK86_CAEEX|nr:hypothetical protein CEXT_516641 [Caerostris extrusa]